ncbi:hypothetical protein TRVA0_048S00496 [Trichomonascus vanleenenianus]|uniref:uncharacterized protein n=1 Tax=Trichomonascus vanleenenianus TaxID=2268995 RepID=UPI003ECB1401
MVSKVSVVSLALAVASVLGQTSCTLSDSVQKIVTDINTLSTDSGALSTNCTDWLDGTLTDLETLLVVQRAVFADVQHVASDFESTDSKADCEVAAVLTAFASAVPNVLAGINGFAGVRIGDTNSIYNLAQNAVTMLANAYTWLPCDVVGSIFSAVDEITQALDQFQNAWGEDVIPAPAQPPTCGGSAPACKKTVPQ